MVDNGSGLPRKDFAEGVVEPAKTTMRQAYYKAKDAGRRAASRARAAGRQADVLISEQTYPALAVVAMIALGVGLALGLALGRRD